MGANALLAKEDLADAGRNDGGRVSTTGPGVGADNRHDRRMSGSSDKLEIEDRKSEERRDAVADAANGRSPPLAHFVRVGSAGPVRAAIRKEEIPDGDGHAEERR